MHHTKEPNTVPSLLRNVVSGIHPENHTFLLHKAGDSWKEISYKETLDTADAISSYFLDMGIRKGDRLGLILENSPSYIFYDQGLQQIGAVNVSIYPTLTENEIEYIINDAGIRTIIVGTAFLLKKIFKVANNCPSLQRIIPAFDQFEKHVQDVNISAGIIGFKQLIEEGKKSLTERKKQIDACREAILPSDLSALIYTSGTTGIPKGVMLSHANFVENAKASLLQIPVVTKDDMFLSFLPLSHVFERTATYHISCTAGCRIAFSQSLELLARNMEEVKPSIMACVPRLLERIHDKAIKSGTQGGGPKAAIFNWALATGERYRTVIEAGKSPGILLSVQQKLADRLVFSKIKEKTGGNLKFFISGGAALPKNVGEFFGNLGIKVLEGFGLTETSPVMSVTEYDRQIYGTVGRILPGIEVGIQDVDTKKIHTVQTHQSFDENLQSPEGEIIVRGHCVMKGYWNKGEETALVIDHDGWFHTGDIGQFFKGNLKITDRIKNILVNSFGKNIYPTPVENTYLKSQKIEQIFLIGDKREYITAIVVPSKESLQEAFGFTEEFFERPEMFISEAEVISWIADDIKRLSGELAKFERIKNFKVKRLPFSIEAGEMTPSLKAKRKVIEKKYADDINMLYTEESFNE
ncbi:long-chain acyl-CoA synthetase [Arcticibacter pallidicorallinus]|uniref:Long-chain acyl-CoA synthetase n=1 Tax=Arcticibacter pallidicorallinus TaxID=1259464 RepID=A0A2T0U5G1_9SPHI|nr:long-chain fatty acid--CoA ligase [Arcticibacter pallidicorallinus]PRY53140.1 long-chain acyl-CoA synthetase [Arcticibacter pallidicorallinus]